MRLSMSAAKIWSNLKHQELFRNSCRFVNFPNIWIIYVGILVEIQVKGWDQIERFLWKVVWLLAPWEPAFPQIEFTACKRAGRNTRHRNISSKQKHKYKTLKEIQIFFPNKGKNTRRWNDTEIFWNNFFRKIFRVGCWQYWTFPKSKERRQKEFQLKFPTRETKTYMKTWRC